jgi:RNA polymerase sigma-70 factor (ECF subfamily)
MRDSELLEQFLAGDDEAAELAFEAIVERHGPMVLRICQMVLPDVHLAEDAFQATFLVLARKARALRARSLLGNWLYGVATRTARKAKVMAARRQTRELEVISHRSLAFVEPSSGGPEHDLEQVLHEEIDRLPRAYRRAVVGCYLEGMTQAQAARELRVRESTIRGRLARARKLLGQRLARRGIAPAAGLFALGAAANSAKGGMAGSTIQATARAALFFVRQGNAAHGTVSATVRCIASGVLFTMRFSQLKTIAATFIAAGLLTTGVTLLTPQQVDAEHPVNSLRAESQSKIVAEPVEPAQDIDANKTSRAQGQDQEKQEEQSGSPKLDPDLVKQISGSIIRAVPVSKDCMVLAYLPDWNHGNVDNIGIGNNDGGVRTLLNWPNIPVDQAASPERQFLIALYSRQTISHPPAGSILAFEILKEWPERTSWKTQPRYSPEPAATYEFKPGEGWKLFDVTPLVRHQAKAGRENYGVLFRFLNEDISGGPNDIHSDYKIVSREGAGEWATRRPMLLVVHAPKPLERSRSETR